jgi:hypothetical protein
LNGSTRFVATLSEGLISDGGKCDIKGSWVVFSTVEVAGSSLKEPFGRSSVDLDELSLINVGGSFRKEPPGSSSVDLDCDFFRDGRVDGSISERPPDPRRNLLACSEVPCFCSSQGANDRFDLVWSRGFLSRCASRFTCDLMIPR